MNFTLQHEPMAAWQWCYNFNIFLMGMMLFGVVMTQTLRHEIWRLSRWIIVPTGFGIIYTISFPWNLLVAMMIHMVMSNLGAPAGAVLLSACFSIFVWVLCVRTLFIPHRA
jgi:hypothetical protein